MDLKKDLYLKMKSLKFRNLFYENYFKNLNDKDIYLILGLNEEESVEYFNLVGILYKREKLKSFLLEEKLKNIMTIAFSNSNKRARQDFYDLVLDTNFLDGKNIEMATLNFFNINELKRNTLIDLFIDLEDLYNVDLSKIVLDIKNSLSKSQMMAMYYILGNKKCIHSKNIKKVISMIKKYPNFKYYQKFISLIIDHDFIEKDKYLEQLELFLSIDNKDQVDLFYTVLTKKEMLNSKLESRFIDYIVEKGPRNYYDSFKELVLRKDKLDDYLFRRIGQGIVDAKNKEQRDSLLTLTDFDFKDNYAAINLLIEGIINSKEFIQREYLEKLKYYDFIFANLVFTKDVIDTMLKTKIEYQLQGITSCIRSLYYFPNYKEILNGLIESSEIISLNTNQLLKIKDIKNRSDFFIIYDKFRNLKSDYQIELFFYLLRLNNVDFQKRNYLLERIKRSNKEQCEAVYELYDKEFYNNEHYKLIRYLFLFKDKKHIELFKLILINISKIGYERAIELINYIKENEVDINIFYQVIKRKLEDGEIEIASWKELIEKNGLQKEIDKIKKLKINPNIEEY